MRRDEVNAATHPRDDGPHVRELPGRRHVSPSDAVKVGELEPSRPRSNQPVLPPYDASILDADETDGARAVRIAVRGLEVNRGECRPLLHEGPGCATPQGELVVRLEKVLQQALVTLRRTPRKGRHWLRRTTDPATACGLERAPERAAFAQLSALLQDAAEEVHELHLRNGPHARPRESGHPTTIARLCARGQRHVEPGSC